MDPHSPFKSCQAHVSIAFNINQIDSLNNSDWIEWNGGPQIDCLINVLCGIKLTLRDKNKNLVAVPNVLSNDDVDIVMFGSKLTLYI